MSGLLADIKWSVCMSKSHRNLCVIFKDSLLSVSHSLSPGPLPKTYNKSSQWLFAFWRQLPTRHQLYGHLLPITKTILVRQTRHAGHCWRSRDELISDVLLWTPTYDRAKVGPPARTYFQQLCEDTGCSHEEDLPEAMNDREKWRERVRDIPLAARHDDDDDDDDLTHSWGGVISPKVNIIARLKFELANFGAAVCHYTTETPHEHYMWNFNRLVAHKK